MPKAKKKKNRDFQKVKLKVGKKLPKAANYTDTRFKVAQIKVHQRLSSATGDISEPKTHRKLNLKELLSHLNHHNGNVRKNGVLGLLEISNMDEQLIYKNLAPILASLSPLFYDVNGEVRSATSSLFQKIISQTSFEVLIPFMSNVFAHLSCAMTNINEGIQLDSLKFIDALMSGPPQLLSIDNGSILKNFIELITKYKSSSSLVVLVTYPISKRATQKWRQKILKRLEKFLAAQVDSVLTKGATDEEPITINCCNRDLAAVYVEIPCLQYNQLTKSHSMSIGEDVVYQHILDYTSTLTNLLYETWMDIVPIPRLGSLSEGTLIQSDTAFTLSIIASILSSLISLQTRALPKTRTDHFSRNKNLARLVSAMKGALPISQIIVQCKSKGKSKKNVSSTFINLKICHIVCQIIIEGILSDPNGESANYIATYISTYSSFSRLSSDETVTLLSICKCLILLKQFQVLDLMEQLYTDCSFFSQQKKSLLHTILDLISDQDSIFSSVIKHSSTASICRTLPDVLASVSGQNVAIETAVLRGIKLSSRHKLIDVNYVIEELISKCLAQVSPPLTTSLIDLLYDCDLTKDAYTELARVLCNPSFPQEKAVYLLHVLLHRVLSKPEMCNHHSQQLHWFMSFLATVFIGRKVEHKNTDCNELDASDTLVISELDSCDYDYYRYHRILVLDVCRETQNMDHIIPISQVILSFLLQYMNSVQVLSLYTAQSIIVLTTTVRFISAVDVYHLVSLSKSVLSSIETRNFELPLDIKSQTLLDILACFSRHPDFTNVVKSMDDLDGSGDSAKLTNVVLEMLMQLFKYFIKHPTSIVHHIEKLTDIMAQLQVVYPSIIDNALWVDMLYRIQL